MSTIRYATRIIVMQNSRIVEQGTHEELMELQGVYHYMTDDYKEQYRTDDRMETVIPSIYKVSLIKRIII